MQCDILCAGEAIIDMIAEEQGPLCQARTFRRMLGGSPANVAIGIARLGTRSGFIGAVADDPFGEHIIAALKDDGVDVSGVCRKSGTQTRLAFVSIDRTGERDFSFYGDAPADTRLTKEDFRWGMIADAKILHISSFLLLSPTRAGLVQWLCEKAVDYGTQVSFDPNLRLSLWKSRDVARRVLRRIAKKCAIFRGNVAEGRFLTLMKSPETAAAEILRWGTSLVVLTDGASGCYFRTQAASGWVEGFKVRAVDTTGCGDGFLAGLLDGIVRSGKEAGQLSEAELTDVCRRANAVGALVASSSGAAEAMPARRAVEKFLASER